MKLTTDKISPGGGEREGRKPKHMSQLILLLKFFEMAPETCFHFTESN